MLDDAELLRRFADEGDESAFAEFVRRRIDFVYATALRQTPRNSALAQEITQTVFIDLARKAAALTRHAAPIGWLHTATRFAAAKAMRSEVRRITREKEAAAMEELIDQDAASADWSRVQPVLDEALGELRERERQAVLLRFFAGLSFAEIGTKLAVTETAARSCVNRALDKLHVQLARRGVTSASAALAGALSHGAAAVAAPAGLAPVVSNAALAGGAAATIGPMVLFMSTNKILVGVTGVVLAATAIVIGVQQRANAALRREKEELQRQNHALIERAANERSAAPPALRADTAELAELQTRSQELAAQLQQLTATLPPASQMKRQDTWRNRGRETPADAFETILWASFNNDTDTLVNSFEFTPAGRARMETFFAGLPASVRAKHGSVERLLAPLFAKHLLVPNWRLIEERGWRGRMAYRVVGEDQKGSNSVQLRLLVNFFPSKPEGNQRVSLRRTDDGWRSGPWAESVVERFIAQIDPATGEVMPEKK